MRCEFAHDDGAYVLGALSPAERLAFERHLSACAECSRAVGELAGLPGLLGRVDASLLEPPEADDPLPTRILPALVREVHHARRRRRFAASGLAAAAVAVVASVAVVLWQVGGDETAAPPVTAPSSTTADAPVEIEARPMRPIGDVPVRATVSLEPVSWGTRLGLDCTYDTASVEYELPPEVDYTLFVRTRDGRAEQVGSWRSVDGQPMQLSAATAATPDELKSIEVRTVDGRIVLRLAT